MIIFLFYLIKYNNKNLEGDLKNKRKWHLDEYNKADVIVFIDNSYGLQVPGKTLELLSLNKPILFIYMNDELPTLFYAKGYKGLVMVKNNEVDILNVLNNIHKKISKKIEPFNIEKYFWRNLVKKYSGILLN